MSKYIKLILVGIIWIAFVCLVVNAIKEDMNFRFEVSENTSIEDNKGASIRANEDASMESSEITEDTKQMLTSTENILDEDGIKILRYSLILLTLTVAICAIVVINSIIEFIFGMGTLELCEDLIDYILDSKKKKGINLEKK